MAPTPGRNLVTALDVGTSKVCALIAEPGEDGSLRVLGTGQRESRGVKRGAIADMERGEAAIREAVEQAERIAGTNIEQVFAGFSAGGLVSNVASVEVGIGGRRIERDDIDALLAEGRASLGPIEGRMILHALPALYTLDGLTGVKKPLGLHADKLAVDIHVVAAEPSPVRNLDLCVRSAHLGVEAIVAAPVAAGKACLGEEERELGVALVELGAGVTNVSVFAGGMLVGLKTLPLGGIDITDDIAAAFGTRRAEAERMKCFYGSATTSPRDNHDMLDVTPIGAEEGGETGRITRAQLVHVIRQRLDLLTGEIAGALKELGFAGPFARQVVLTGGGAELKGIADYAQGVLGRAVRIGRPAMPGLPDAHAGPAFATLAGLAQFAASRELDLRTVSGPAPVTRAAAGGNVVQRLIAAFRSGY